MSNDRVVLDVDMLVKAVYKSIKGAAHESTVEFFDAIDDLRESMGISRDIYSSQLFEYHAGMGLIDKVVDSVQEENRDNWITVRKAAERRNVAQNTIRSRIDSGKFDVQMLANEDNEIVQHVNVMQVDAEVFGPGYTKGVKRRKNNTPSHSEARKRRRVVMQILSDGADHPVENVVSRLMNECNFTGRNARPNAFKLINNMVKDREINWRSGGGDNTTPRAGDYIFAPGQARMGSFVSREADFLTK